MIKAWLNMWRNAFNYKGNVSRKEYWCACVLNLLAMFIFVVPFALIIRNLPISPEIASVIFLILFHIPTVALYFRRANDANWKVLTSLYTALICPIISGLIVGAVPSIPKGELWPRFYSIICKLFSLSFGLFLYGGVIGIVLHGDPTAIPAMPISGLILGAFTLIIYGIVNWKEILAFFAGIKID